jgi:hypothetical protein
LLAEPAAVGDLYDDTTEVVGISRSRVQELEACALRAELDARNIQSLQEQLARATDALTRKDELGDRQAEALMEVARASGNGAHVVLRAEVAAQLATIHAAVTSKLALELHPVRTDRSQFATLHIGPVPFDEFDTVWCASACGEAWKVDVDPVAHMRAHVTQHGGGYVTLRGVTPLPRRLPTTGASQQQLPSYRVIIEAYPAPADGEVTHYCNVGLVPSHSYTDGAVVTPVVGHDIRHCGGWWFQVNPMVCRGFNISSTVLGWKPLLPRVTVAGDAAAADTSAYATTDVIPPVPAGGAIEFAVDYAAGTCRVAFYTPAAVAGEFAEAPYAKMELRFVATAAEVLPKWGAVPARSVPTAAGNALPSHRHCVVAQAV